MSNQHENAGTMVERAPTIPDRDQTMPLGVGNFDDQVNDPLGAESTTRRRIDSSAVLIAAVVVVAAVGLYSMRSLARAAVTTPAMDDATKTVDIWLRERSLNGGDDGEESLLSIISEAYTGLQVPLADVQKNPFVIFEPRIEVEEDQPVVDSHATKRAWDEERILREEEIRNVASRLVLRSVLMASTPLANLNDKIVRLGDPVLMQPEGIEFRITAIESEAVTMVAEEPRYKLTVEVQVKLLRN